MAQRLNDTEAIKKKPMKGGMKNAFSIDVKPSPHETYSESKPATDNSVGNSRLKTAVNFLQKK